MIVGRAPLTIARTATGTAIYIYPGQPAVGLDEADAERLLDEGFLVEIPDVLVPEIVPTPDDPGTGTAIGEGSAPATVRPKNTALKSDWLAFRGIPEADGEQFTKGELQDDELMDDWARSLANPVEPEQPGQPGEVEHADGTRDDVLRDAIDQPDVVGDPADVGQPVGAAAPDAS